MEECAALAVGGWAGNLRKVVLRKDAARRAHGRFGGGPGGQVPR